METEAGRRLRLRDAIVALYLKRTSPATVAEDFSGVSRRRVTELCDTLPQGLIENAQRMQVSRAANKAARHVARSCYTEWELQEAVANFASRKMTAAQIQETYGVPRKTLQKKRKVLDASVGRSPDIKEAKLAARAVKVESPGP